MCPLLFHDSNIVKDYASKVLKNLLGNSDYRIRKFA